MIITITNTSGVTLNDLDTYTAGSGPAGIVAIGGSRKYPLPFPFGHIGPLANNGTKALAMKPRDFGKRHVSATLSVAEEWNALVQQGWITFAIAAESTTRDVEDKFFDAV